jgi:hypothetical protein
MDERLVRALLTVVNADCEKPKDAVWCAEFSEISSAAQERGVRMAMRFWLVSDDSEFMGDKSLIFAAG